MDAGSAELRRGASSVRVDVSPGGPITSYCADGYEWCAAGAWREYAPTAGACTLPTFVAGAPRGAFPEGGLLAHEAPAVDIVADGAQSAINATWPVTVYPLTWARSVSLDGDGALCLRYEVRNAHRAPLPFVWGLAMALPWAAASEIDVARGARARVAASIGEGLPRAGSEFAWPALRDGGRLLDLARPAQLGARSAVDCYVEMARGRFVARSGRAAIEITGDEGIVTHAFVRANNDADMPGAPPRRWWRRRAAQHALVVGPAVGAPGLLSDAVGLWNSARWIEPGDVLRWTVRCRPVAQQES